MNRSLPSSIIILQFTALILCAGWAQPVEAKDSPMNVVFILADDLGWADLACYGGDYHETPNIDRLADSGVRFTQAYSASPVCTPTRASIMTGKHPARLHMTIWSEAAINPPMDRKMIPAESEPNLPLAEHTLAEAFKEAGYETAHIGKWHLGDANHYPETQGFDWNIGGTHWGAPATFFFPYRGPFHEEIRYVPHLEGGKAGEYLTNRLTDEALAFIERPRESPFFLYMAYHSVHTPIEAPEADVEAYRKKLKPEYKHQNPIYAAMVSTLDKNVGRILEKLETLGISENTIVIFASDNGGFVFPYRNTGVVTDNFPLRSGKGSLYEGGIRVPFIAKVPGLTPSGVECDTQVSSVDFYPTLLDLTGIEISADAREVQDGVSLVSLLNDPDGSLEDRALYFHYPHYYFAPKTTPCSAIRKGDWKLIEHFEDEKVELFNLAEDLSESKDLSKENPEKTSELMNDLKVWRDRVDAQMPKPNPNS
ncbi:MAG: sulfatase [Candidatus Omnitrophica bacterium]|nr:sulfatase [Candidatus Omnitrophota bacterium]